MITKTYKTANSYDIAVEFLYQAKDKYDITNLKLQKLMYIANGVFLAYCDSPIIDEEFNAYKHGAILPSIYRQFKIYYHYPINIEKEILEYAIQNCEIESYHKDCVKSVLDRFGDRNAVWLCNLTCQKGTPWRKTYKKGAFNVIDNDIIRNHFMKYLMNVSLVNGL